MSRTLDLLADIALHGTVDGYRAGCTGNHCPSPITCAEVYTRYSGDWGYRKAVNAGGHPAQLILQERENAKAQRVRDIEANKAERKRAAKADRDAERRRKGLHVPQPRVKREPKPKREPRPTTAQLHGDRIRALHGEGMSDASIGAILGIPQTTAQYVRKQVLKLPANRQTAAGSLIRARAERITELHAQGMTDDQIAADLGSTRATVWKAREKLALDRNPAPRPAGKPSKHLPDVARLHGEGLTDKQIGERLGIVKQYAAKLRRDLHLPAHHPVRPVAPRKQRVSKPREVQPHGTNACWARGCRRDECIEAHRQYHRDYVAGRRAEGAREYHGTAYGYQLGCRGRSCPAEVSCTDAMLEAERARRRAAGIPAKEFVPAAPVQAHIADLTHAGVSIEQIAERSGLTFAIIRKMIHSHGKDRGVVREVLAERAAAVLAVGFEEKAA